jgi:hypothetical protein
MSKRITIQTTIFGGLPVEADVVIHPSEPDVGIFSESVEIDELRWRRRARRGRWVKGRPLTGYLMDRLTLTDHERIAEDALEY